MRGLVALGLFATLCAGCGASEQQEVAAAIRASDAAWERGAYDEACSRMTAHARKLVMSGSITPDARTCGEAFSLKPEPIAYVTVNSVATASSD